MKNTIKIIPALLLLLIVNTSSKAQQLVQTPNDVNKLKENEQLFINKPLKNLLKEIKPELKLVRAEIDQHSYFSFYFISHDEVLRLPTDSIPLGFYVYIKETLDWDINKRSKETQYKWTKEDLEKYGNLTVTRIKIRGKVK
ncbi:hypothetical protein PQ462_10970 [Flavobacterium sp. KACC 22758]|uniref:hypothetical protein n=1 Tax=Flavobacterium sp. KACC 22758 TaxID=3025667 RepID=UPI002365B2DD|nr:hypothetical protein [Flavobacterium sp. KACC 22758]WDF61887.1 hypothetical protein PQ462_10970 [Flavobacterium sp. KACC 22758]